MSLVLQTERLQLREMNEQDLGFLTHLLSHPQVMRFYPRLYSKAETKLWIERQRMRYQEHGHGLWIVQTRDKTPLGQVGLLLQQVEGDRLPEIGYMLHCDYWGKGYATEAALAVRNYAFDHLCIPRVISLIRPTNLASRRVAHSMGMTATRGTIFANLEHTIYQKVR